MKDIPDLVPDPEVFRRVWQRVMPDPTISPVVPAPLPAPPKPPAPPPEEDAAQRVLRALDEGLLLAGELARREPGGRALVDSLRKSAAPVRAEYFFRTGKRWSPRPAAPPKGMTTAGLLRELYRWELDFSRLCRRLEGEAWEELAPALAEASKRRRAWMRSMV